jgi:hypothetical protein
MEEVNCVPLKLTFSKLCACPREEVFGNPKALDSLLLTSVTEGESTSAVVGETELGSRDQG